MTVRYPYTAEIQEDGKYLVEFPDFPYGCTEGDTLEEAAAMAKELLECFVEDYEEQGKALPSPSPAGDNPVAEV